MFSRHLSSSISRFITESDTFFPPAIQSMPQRTRMGSQRATATWGLRPPDRPFDPKRRCFVAQTPVSWMTMFNHLLSQGLWPWITVFSNYLGKTHALFLEFSPGKDGLQVVGPLLCGHGWMSRVAGEQLSVYKSSVDVQITFPGQTMPDMFVQFHHIPS